MSPRQDALMTGRVQGALASLCALGLGLLIARAPASDIETEALMAAETAAAIAKADAAAANEPCWDQLPMRKAITQANIDRLCVKAQAARAGKVEGRQ